MSKKEPGLGLKAGNDWSSKAFSSDRAKGNGKGRGKPVDISVDEISPTLKKLVVDEVI